MITSLSFLSEGLSERVGNRQECLLKTNNGWCTMFIQIEIFSTLLINERSKIYVLN